MNDSNYLIIDQEEADTVKRVMRYRVRGFKTLKQAVSSILKEGNLSGAKIARLVNDFDIIETNES